MKSAIRFWWWLRGSGSVVVNAVAQSFTRTLADAVTGIDRLDRGVAYQRTRSTSLTASEHLATDAGSASGVSDAVGGADTVGVAMHYFRTLSDGLTGADVLSSPTDAVLPRRLNTYTLNALSLN